MIKAPTNVNNDGNPTERGRKTTTLIVSLLSSDRSDLLRRQINTLPTAVRQMLQIVVATMRQGGGTAEGVAVWQTINRAAIAEALDKPALIPYDIVKLRKLVDAGLLVEQAEINPRGLGGSEYVYSIPPDLLAGLVEHFDPAAFAQRRVALIAQAERAQAERAERLRQDPDLALAEKHRFESFETDKYFYRWDFERNKHMRRRKTLIDRLGAKLAALVPGLS